jgi:hypothetical protein
MTLSIFDSDGHHVAETGAPYSVVSMRVRVHTFNAQFAYHEGVLFPAWKLRRLVDEDILESLS